MWGNIHIHAYIQIDFTNENLLWLSPWSKTICSQPWWTFVRIMTYIVHIDRKWIIDFKVGWKVKVILVFDELPCYACDCHKGQKTQNHAIMNVFWSNCVCVLNQERITLLNFKAKFPGQGQQSPSQESQYIMSYIGLYLQTFNMVNTLIIQHLFVHYFVST